MDCVFTVHVCHCGSGTFEFSSNVSPSLCNEKTFGETNNWCTMHSNSRKPHLHQLLHKHTPIAGLICIREREIEKEDSLGRMNELGRQSIR